jgi:hypothetical protein
MLISRNIAGGFAVAASPSPCVHADAAPQTASRLDMLILAIRNLLVAL